MLSELDLKRGQKVLEIGSGSGYVLALISEIVGGEISGLEIIPELAEQSRENLRDYKNVEIFKKSGLQGFLKKFPFDRILVSAAVRELPEELLAQLNEKGILVIPQGSRFEQEIVVIQRRGNEFVIKREFPGFVFVPFVNKD